MEKDAYLEQGQHTQRQRGVGLEDPAPVFGPVESLPHPQQGQRLQRAVISPAAQGGSHCGIPLLLSRSSWSLWGTGEEGWRDGIFCNSLSFSSTSPSMRFFSFLLFFFFLQQPTTLYVSSFMSGFSKYGSSVCVAVQNQVTSPLIWTPGLPGGRGWRMLWCLPGSLWACG